MEPVKKKTNHHIMFTESPCCSMGPWGCFTVHRNQFTSIVEILILELQKIEHFRKPVCLSAGGLES
jgi:hypothetical protein